MQYITNNFDEIEAYIQGEMDEEKAKLFLEKLQIDEELFRDFQLWTKIDNFFDDSHFYEIESTIEIEIKESSKNIKGTPSNRIHLFSNILKIAVCIALLGSFCGLIYQQFYNLESLQGSLVYSKALYINSNSTNANKPLLGTKSIDWILGKSLNTDTTYQFVFENDEPQKIIIRVPRIRYSDRQKLIIRYDDSIKMYILNMGHKKILLKPTKNWQKVQYLPPK